MGIGCGISLAIHKRTMVAARYGESIDLIGTDSQTSASLAVSLGWGSGRGALSLTSPRKRATSTPTGRPGFGGRLCCRRQAYGPPPPPTGPRHGERNRSNRAGHARRLVTASGLG